MLNVEQVVIQKFPGFADKPAALRKPTLSLLKKLIHQDEINQFLEIHRSTIGEDFIAAVFAYFNFSYRVNKRDKANIPSTGRVVIFANHPIGTLDGLAILKLVREVRKDVKILANDLLMNFENLHEFFIPLDNMTGGSPRQSYKKVLDELNRESAIIIFPSGEVSRARPTGVMDTRWRPGFLHFARKTNSPLLPIHINAKNSLLFYGASAIFKPLGTALLAHEMFNKCHSEIKFSIGEPIPVESLYTKELHDKTLVNRLKKHVYKIGRDRRKSFAAFREIAAPESAEKILRDLANAQRIGKTSDNNEIYLAHYKKGSSLIKEVGRQREIAFRAAGEGTGRKRDLDKFDRHYLHLVLWNAQRQEIAGAYRLACGKSTLKKRGLKGFYTSTLYRYSLDIEPYLSQGIELGRSFVAPRYWGRACLDYLWLGLGAYLAHHSELRYLLGPVSMSAEYPRELMDILVYFNRRYYGTDKVLARANHPYLLSSSTIEKFDRVFAQKDVTDAMNIMQGLFADKGFKLPVLFKQYTALFEEGGFHSIVFSRDPDFGDCLDGLCMADLNYLKASKRKRYIDSALHEPGQAESML